MIIGVDIGGTKTLVAVFAENGKILHETVFETPRSYEDFLTELGKNTTLFETSRSKIVSIAVPGAIERDSGRIIGLGNLPWKDKYIQHDAAKALSVEKSVVENDANLAALAEARALPKPEDLVLYITLSTGIGSGIIVANKLLPELAGSEAGQMMVRDASGDLHRWETFASGKALVSLTGQRAEDLTDKKMWQMYIEKVCLGLQPTISVLRPNKVIIGGGVGAHLEKFGEELATRLAELNHSKTYTNPEVIGAHYGEKSVIYGCYHYAKDHLA